ncbi:chemotaxis response regulator protein-glutamate methylesterase [Geomonas sp. Red69]|uniref:Protein-glutamate methylesterase/protein-glutamine glutaminase n=1 Tax=Geomonas diazotrophica TaxID=2843197 RepID=A0ABX8JFW6_9BACT|nr:MULTISPECIES: chemotaxis response regulator protein-glutamate methylesterase [Geomonas]MBU5637831.1 chemotaxis response regulator protein-glutamate methylesterase [Geomonas diazotrophica]QWV96362.1 chemotaxis response regulator protein-glutamate methylesterase [Geomonas nitrogeniifigens]
MGGLQKKIRVLVVDDSAFVRRAILRMFEKSPDIEVVGVAANGESAVELARSLRPDVITLDVQMPVLDGLSALELIMKECPAPVIMFSCLTGKGAEKTMKALDIGAVDFVDKSSAGGAMDIGALAKELTGKIKVAAGVDLEKLRAAARKAGTAPPSRGRTKGEGAEVVVMGTSTGGPPALQQVLGRMQPPPCPILIVQHMPPGFTASLAARLDRHSALTVREASDGEVVVAGNVYLAPAGWHMRLRRKDGALQVWLDPAPGGHLHCPSVDALFDSAAEVCGDRTLGVVLTGMGKDGAAGARAIKKAGGRIVVETEETAIVYGMPKAVADAVSVDAAVPLYEVSDAIAGMI